MRVHLNLNQAPVDVEIEPDTLLVDVIRDLGHTGTKEGCGVGVCGACTVIVDHVPVSSCLYLAACADGLDVWTVEGLTARDPSLRDAFVAGEGMQCGICTSGQVVSTFALRQDNPHATEPQIRSYMAGNLCRCTGYASIVESVRNYLAAQ